MTSAYRHLPAPSAWKGIATRRELLAALVEIRREGATEVDQPARGLHAIAVGLRGHGDGQAALGAYLPRHAPRAGLREGLQRTVTEIVAARG